MSIHRRTLLPVAIAVAIANTSALAQPSVEPEPLTVGASELASLNSQCGPFYFWSSDSSHFHVLLISTTGRYSPVAAADHPALVIDGEFLVESQVTAQRKFDSALAMADPFQVLHAHAEWETQYLARLKGWDSIASELILSMSPPAAPVPSELRLLTYPEAVTLFGHNVDRGLVGTALIGDHIFVVAMPIRQGDELKRSTAYLTGILKGITTHRTRTSLQDNLRSIQVAIAGADGCMDMIRIYQGGRGAQR